MPRSGPTCARWNTGSTAPVPESCPTPCSRRRTRAKATVACFIAPHQRFRLQSRATASRFGTGQYLTIVRSTRGYGTETQPHYEPSSRIQFLRLAWCRPVHDPPFPGQRPRPRSLPRAKPGAVVGCAPIVARACLAGCLRAPPLLAETSAIR
jgi:hypothetical protein